MDLKMERFIQAKDQKYNCLLLITFLA